MRIDLLTVFPGLVEGPLRESMMKRAQEGGQVSIRVTNIRDFAADKHHTTDDIPYGGGAGMVMKPEPIFAALEALAAEGGGSLGRVIAPTPRGWRFDHHVARALAGETRLVFVCGRYEGMDHRVCTRWVTDEYSIGDYVLTGGELPALVMIDAIVRWIPGVLGNERSVEEESFAMGLLEYPQYTRPAEHQGVRVPEVLLSGNHEAIRKWRHEEALRITRERRPDLLDRIS